MSFTNIQHCFTCAKDTEHVNGKCQECAIKRINKEKERWRNLSLEEKVEELKNRLDRLSTKYTNTKF